MRPSIRDSKTSESQQPHSAVQRSAVVDIVIWAALLFAVPAILAAQSVSFTEYQVPTPACSPSGITAGSDGALWFVEYESNKIGRITTSGVFTEYPVPTANSFPFLIAAGADGALWFTEVESSKIGRITTSGVINEYPVPTPGSAPEGIASGSDGALWFTEYDLNRIGRITTSGVFTEYPVPTANSTPGGITAGPDGALWFTETNANKIGRITTSGVLTEYPVPTSASSPFSITAGPDGALWFTEGANKIGRITTSGAFTEYPVPTLTGGPIFITAGPDGALWFTEGADNTLRRITTSGIVTGYAVPTPDSTLFGIVTGPDGALWITDSNGNRIVRAAVSPTTPITIQANPSGLQFSVDGGTPQSAPQTLNLSQGSHTIAVATPQPGAAGTQYVFTSWSDGGAASHTITVGGSAATYTATFTTQYQLTISASPPAGGTVTPASGGYYDAGTVVSILANPNSGYSFTGWSGNVANAGSASTTVTMNAPQTVTANFSLPTNTSVTIQTNPSGLQFSVDSGAPQAAPRTMSLSQGLHTIAVAATQSGGPGTQYVFTGWSDGGGASHSITVGASPAAYTASFKTQYQLMISATPTIGGMVTPATGAYYDAGTSVPIIATPNSGYSFTNWTGNVANAGSASTTVTMNGPQTVTANFATATPPPCTYSLSASSATVGSSVPNGSVTGSVTVTTTAGCTFTASAPPGSFASITNGPNYTGTSPVIYSVQANSGSTRSTMLIITGQQFSQQFTINQLNGCAFGLTPSSASFSANGGPASFNIGASSPTCSFTATSSDTSFLIVSGPTSGTGNSTVNYTVFSNSSTAGRTGTITVAGQTSTVTFTVLEAGTTCTYALAQANQAFTSVANTGSISVQAPAGCSWSATSASSFVTINGATSGSGNGPLNYTVQANSTSAQRIGSLIITGTTGLPLPYAVTQSGASPLNCTASAPAAAQVAIEGRTEVLGDLIVSCTGLSGPLTADISLTLNTNVTNAINGSTIDASLLVNESNPQNGAVAGYNTIDWPGVSLVPVTGGTATVRITNVRADASLLPAPASLQSVPITGAVNITAAVTVPVASAMQTLAFAGPTLVFQRMLASTVGTATTIPLQYQEATITGFHAAAGSTPGTRLRLVLSGVPSTVQVSVPVFNSDPVTRAQLVSADINGNGGSLVPGNSGSYEPLTVSPQGTATATWVVLTADPAQFETDTFPLLLQNASATDISQIQVAASFAPVSFVSVASAVGSTAPVPRYRDFSVTQPLVNLRATSTVQGQLNSSSAAFSNHAATPRLIAAAVASNATFTNQVTNDTQGTTATDVVIRSKVTGGGSITNCPSNATCTPSGDEATVNVGTLDPGQSVTLTVQVTANPCTATICEVDNEVSTVSAQANADLPASSANSVFLFPGASQGVPANLTASGGTPQSGGVGTVFANPLQATVTDSGGNPVSGATVIFAAPSSGASAVLSNSTALTNVFGVASVTATANSIAGGPYAVTATVTGLAPASFMLTNLSSCSPANGDLAQCKSATQSSTLPGSPPAFVAIDGNTDGAFFDGSVTATNLDPNPWWQVDLGASTAIGSIVIWNRTDCCASRLSDYWVFVSNTPFLASDTPATLQGRAGTFSSHQTTAPNPSTSIAAGAQGRYVRVQLSSPGYLSLAEVQVFAGADLALGQTATQSSTLPGTPPAAVAVDGITDGNFNNGSVTATNLDPNPWWQVDLGASSSVGSVVIWNRTDCCASRLSDYWVFVSNTPFLASDTPSTLALRAGTFSSHQTTAPSPSTNIIVPTGTTARYVRVQLSSPNYLSLAEVQVKGPGATSPPNGDLAQGQPATQSSTLPGTPAAGVAVDGNTDGSFYDGSVTATNLDPNPWWQVDLGASVPIGSVVVWNRTDCCGARLNDYWVFISNTPFLPTDTPANLQSQAGVVGIHQTSAPNPSTTISLSATGRYVRVQLTDPNYLSLAEVQVFGVARGPLPGKVASQSSTLPGVPSAAAASAIDGNTDGSFYDGSVTATNLDANAWWQVDLGAPTAVNTVTIWNRTDCCGLRLNDYWVFVSTTPFLATDTPANLQFRAGTFSSHQTTAPNPSVSIPFGVQGRYVRVQLTGTDYLSLAEVQVQ